MQQVLKNLITHLLLQYCQLLQYLLEPQQDKHVPSVAGGVKAFILISYGGNICKRKMSIRMYCFWWNRVHFHSWSDQSGFVRCISFIDQSKHRKCERVDTYCEGVSA